MIIADELLKEHSKRQTTRIGNWIGNDPMRFRELMGALLSDEPLLIQRSAWVLSYCVDRHPPLAEPWLRLMIDRMREPGIHPAVPRNILRELRLFEIPVKYLGVVVTHCFDVLADPESPIAIKVHAMTVLANAAKRQPGLVPEIEQSIQNIPNPSGGIIACGKHTMAALKKIRKAHPALFKRK